MDHEKNVRLTISLPVSILNLLNEVSEKNKRSKLIAEAVRLYAEQFKRNKLKERLIKGYEARAERDKIIAEEWIEVEQESYRTEEKNGQ